MPLAIEDVQHTIVMFKIITFMGFSFANLCNSKIIFELVTFFISQIIVHGTETVTQLQYAVARISTLIRKSLYKKGNPSFVHTALWLSNFGKIATYINWHSNLQ